MSWLGFLSGTVNLKITSASTTSLLDFIRKKGFVLTDITPLDELNVIITLRRVDLKPIKRILLEKGEHCEVCKRSGLYWILARLRRRPILVAGVFLLLVLSLFLPGHILFVRVEGNQNIAERRILDAAQQCGIGFGASRREIRSERVKNFLLEAIPELQWAGINSYGCVATITVRERSLNQKPKATPEICSVVASKDGIIKEMTVLRGNPLCKVGEAVTEGQVLVSGYTDCGLTVRAEAANAEVFAQTKRTLQCISLAESQERGEYLHKEEYFTLKVGKKLINFFKDTGISDTTCVKMYEEKDLILPGGFTLPVTLIKTTYYYYDTTSITAANTEEFSWVNKQSEAYLKSQMLSGRVLQRFETITLTNDICVLSAHYVCEEMIGQIRIEEIVSFNGKSN